MKYTVVYDKPGRIRFRCGQFAFEKQKEAAVIEYLLSEPCISKAEVHSENGGILVYYSKYFRDKVISMVSLLNADRLKEVTDNEYSLEAADRKIKSDLVKLVAGRFFWKAVLPSPLMKLKTIFMGMKYVAKGIRTLFDGKITVDVLDGASVGVSLLQKNYSTAGTIMFMLSVSSLLEDYTRARTRLALADSLAVKADKVWLAGEDKDILISMSELNVGDLIRVRTGSVIPVDGEIADGEAYINESSMTGEPLAASKSVGDTVFAGTVVEEGSIVVKVRELSSNTKINKIIELIDNSENLKSASQSRAETLADRIVPLSFIGFGAVLLLTRNITKAVSVLMVDYSCAIKLSIPVAIISAIKEASDMDITVKGGKFLEKYAEADTIVFDKTGTLTNANPVLEKVVAFGGYTEDEVLKTAACLEEHFPHSVARAIVEGAVQKGLNHEEEHAEVEYIVAHGIATVLHGERAVIGSRHFVCEDENVEITDEQQKIIEDNAETCSIVYLAQGGKLSGVICISDPLRKEAVEAVNSLKKLNLKKVIMLTGDSKNTARAIAAQLDIKDFRSQILPEDKHRIVEQIKSEGHKVIMVGDGINDAPALAAADVSVAMSDASDIAKEAADITLCDSDLMKLCELRILSTRLRERIDRNYRFILTFNSMLLLGGIFGVLTPFVSAFLHNTSTMLICAKSMTPLVKKEHKNNAKNKTCK